MCVCGGGGGVTVIYKPTINRYIIANNFNKLQDGKGVIVLHKPTINGCIPANNFNKLQQSSAATAKSAGIYKQTSIHKYQLLLVF